MGVLKHLLFWPVTGPTFLARFSMEKVLDTARDQVTSDQLVKEDLLELQMRLELGEIDDDEYVELEAALMQRLRDVRYWREQFGMGTSGGPVQVVREPTSAESPAASEIESPPNTDENQGEPPRGGIASPEGAEVEFDLGWDHDD